MDTKNKFEGSTKGPFKSSLRNYYIENRASLMAYYKQYYIDNKTEHLAKMKNKMKTCSICNSTIRSHNFKRHIETSKKHKKNINFRVQFPDL